MDDRQLVTLSFTVMMDNESANALREGSDELLKTFKESSSGVPMRPFETTIFDTLMASELTVYVTGVEQTAPRAYTVKASLHPKKIATIFSFFVK